MIPSINRFIYEAQEINEIANEKTIEEWCDDLGKDVIPFEWTGDQKPSYTMPTPTSHLETLSVKVPQVLKVKIASEARKKGVTTSAYVNEIFVKELLS